MKVLVVLLAVIGCILGKTFFLLSYNNFVKSIFWLQFKAAREEKGPNGLAALLAKQGGFVPLGPRIVGGIIDDDEISEE